MNRTNREQFQKACQNLPDDQRTPSGIKAFRRNWTVFHTLRLGVKHSPAVGDGYQLPRNN